MVDVVAVVVFVVVVVQDVRAVAVAPQRGHPICSSKERAEEEEFQPHLSLLPLAVLAQ